MKSLKTRIATTALAGAMAMSLAVPAFAAGTSTKVTAAYQEIPIEVTVPETGTVILNPMGMPVELAAKTADAAAVVGTQQIVTMPLAIINKSSAALNVGATINTTIKGDLAFAKTGWDAKDVTKAPKTKSVFAYLEMAAGSSVVNTAKDGVDSAKVAAQLKDVAVKKLNDQAAVDGAVKKATGAIVVLKEDEATTVGVMTDGDSPKKCYLGSLTAYDETAKLADGNVGVVYITGQVADDPSEAWTKADGFTSTIAFTFTASAS